MSDLIVGQAVCWETPVTRRLHAGRILEIDNSERQSIFKIETFDSIHLVSGVDLHPMSDEGVETVMSELRLATRNALRSLGKEQEFSGGEN